MCDYENGKIYKIVNDVDDEIYIGSTTQPLCRRFGDHKSNSKSKPNRTLYKKMNKHGAENFRIILVENYPCKSVEELRSREEYWRNELKASLNMVSCNTGLTGKRTFEERVQ